MAKERQALPSRVATERRAERCHCWTRKGVERQALPWLVGAERPGRRAQRTNLQGASVLTPLALRVSVLAGFRNQGFQERICLNSLGGAVSATSECMTPDRYCCMSPTLQPTRNWHTVRNGTCEWANGAGTIMRRCSKLRGSAVQEFGGHVQAWNAENPGARLGTRSPTLSDAGARFRESLKGNARPRPSKSGPGPCACHAGAKGTGGPFKRRPGFCSGQGLTMQRAQRHRDGTAHR
jgi:hypothetical protein